MLAYEEGACVCACLRVSVFVCLEVYHLLGERMQHDCFRDFAANT
jgi:hypothetical protein